MRIDVRGLGFEVGVGGPEDGQPVLLLHGFPQHRGEWDGVLPALHAAGLRSYALDQRGYSPDARPAAVADYRLGEAAADAIAVLDALGVARAHVVGHDWGASVGWLLAGRYPDRVRTLTAISVPHPDALADALHSHPAQRLRLAYMPLFRRRGLAERLLLARDGAGLRLVLGGLDRQRQDRYVRPMQQPGALTAALNWYRASNLRQMGRLGPVAVPTSYLWSDRDVVVPQAARACGDHVTADYRFVRVTGVNHWIPDLAPQAVADAVLARTATG